MEITRFNWMQRADAAGEDCNLARSYGGTKSHLATDSHSVLMLLMLFRWLLHRIPLLLLPHLQHPISTSTDVRPMISFSCRKHSHSFTTLPTALMIVRYNAMRCNVLRCNAIWSDFCCCCNLLCLCSRLPAHSAAGAGKARYCTRLLRCFRIRRYGTRV